MSLQSTLTAIGDAIRTKTNTTGTLSLAEMPAAILSITEGSGSGECTRPHIIEVDTLPTENIDENALYKCDGNYYEYGSPELTAIYVSFGGSFVDYKSAMIELGMLPENISYNTLPAQTNDGILESVLQGDTVDLYQHFYYIINLDDVYVFMGGEWLSMSDPSISGGMHYGGVISDVSEATDTSAYYAQLEGGDWVEYVTTPTTEEIIITPTKQTQEQTATNADYISKVTVNPIPDAYIIPTGTVEITEPGQYTIDITDKASALVNIETPEAPETPEVSGAEFNVAFGDTAPEDTSKLWVKTEEPTAVEVRANYDFVGNGELHSGFAAFPLKISSSAAAAVGTKVYFFGGTNTDDSTNLNTIYIFDTVTNTIEASSATLQSAARSIAAVVIDTKIYLFGGYPVVNTIQVFDTVTDTIETLSVTLPTAAYGICAAAIGTKIYLLGGHASGTTILNKISIFNTDTNTMETLTNTLPTNICSAPVAVFGTKIYIFGGNWTASKVTETIRIYDTDTNTVTTSSATLPSALQDLAIASIGTKSYLFGGTSGGVLNSTCYKFYMFDAVTDTIETLSPTLPSLCYSTSAAAVGTDIYIGCVRYNELIYRFPVAIDLPENHLLIEASLSDNLFKLFPNMDMGVKNVYLGNAEGKAEKVVAALYKDGEWKEI